jgi:hypothetical protein
VAVSRPLARSWSIAGELSGNAHRGATAQSQFLAALSYAVTPRVVLDCGAAWGLARQGIDHNLFAGITVLLD